MIIKSSLQPKNQVVFLLFLFIVSLRLVFFIEAVKLDHSGFINWLKKVYHNLEGRSMKLRSSKSTLKELVMLVFSTLSQLDFLSADFKIHAKGY